MVSIATFVVFVKTFYSMFLSPKPHDLEVVDKEVPKAMVFAMAVLLIVIIALGIFPDVVTGGISNYVGGLLP
jgi:energy-converting hydrogenase B subunit F